VRRYSSIGLILGLAPLLLGAESASTIERSQEILREDQALRQRIEQEEKFFVKSIILKGCLRLSEEEIKDIITPFQEEWVTKGDIQQIIDALKLKYAKKGIGANHLEASYELKKGGALEITVNELTK